MKNYERPLIIANDSLAEGVYAASGSNAAGGGGREDCYTVSAYIHQYPQTGRQDYRIQVNGVHAAGNGHHSGAQHLLLSFNQPVKYISSNGTLAGGSDTSCIEITYAYHNNGNDNIGLGDVVVESEDGLEITGSVLTCNYDCGQHTW